MDCKTLAPKAFVSPYDLLFQALTVIPVCHYILAAFFILLIFLYSFLEIHFLHDLFTLFRGDPIMLAYNSCSELCQAVVAKCNILRGRYSVTPWLSSPYLQTASLSVFGSGPPCCGEYLRVIDSSAAIKGDKTPIVIVIVIVIPGLTSDSSSVYAKHLALSVARLGWNVVVSNHRGLGGVSLTVKYLGEDGSNTPLAGAAAICCPWDLLMQGSTVPKPLQSSTDQGPSVNVMGDGMVAAGKEPSDASLEDAPNKHMIQSKKDEETISDKGTSFNFDG